MRIGDPLVSVEAPADAQQVIALLPTGEIKRLTFNENTRRWEARFDIPAYTNEGEYVVTVIIVLKDGTRQVVKVHYQVDLTPPTGVGQARMVGTPGTMLRLDVESSEDTARVAALLPWGERIELPPSTQPHRFFQLITVPSEYSGTEFTVTLVLTDKAHNQTVLTIEASGN